MKKFVLIIAGLVLFSIANANEIRLEVDSDTQGDGCMVAVDIIIDTQDIISATDVVMESNMEFVEFVPADVFPYFFPPKVSTGITHIVGFAVDQSQRFVGRGVLGTVYFKQKEKTDRDGAIYLYFIESGSTIDSNLSLPGGIDVLQNVYGANVSWDTDLRCVHDSSDVLSGISNISWDEIMGDIENDMNKIKNSSGFVGSIYFYISILLLLSIGILVFLKKRKNEK